MTRDLKSPVSTEEINAFFAANLPAGKGACPRCGTDNWLHVSSDNGQEMTGLSVVDRDLGPVGLYATIVLNCSNCGFLSAHMKQRIIDWLDEVGR